MRVRLADGAVELSARVDLAIGRPARDEASVAIVEVTSGSRRVEHRADLHFYALIETLRSPAPPFVVATYYSRTGELDVDPVTDELLVGAARRTLVGARRLRHPDGGTEAGRAPSPWCSRCSILLEGDLGPWPAAAPPLVPPAPVSAPTRRGTVTTVGDRTRQLVAPVSSPMPEAARQHLGQQLASRLGSARRPPAGRWSGGGHPARAPSGPAAP